MNRQETTAAIISVEDYRLRALDLRREGKNFRAIAAQLGSEGGPTSVSRAYELVVEALNELRTTCREAAQDIRDLEIQRDDQMIEELFRRLTNTGAGNAKISSRTAARLVDSILRIQDRKARYLGLDAPKRIEASAPGGAPLLPPGAIAIRLVAPGEPIPPPPSPPAAPEPADPQIAATPTPRADDPPPPYK